MKKATGRIALYMHAGSGNHGCEAIADSLLRQLAASGAPRPVTLVTNSAEEDLRYGLGTFGADVEILEEQAIAARRLTHALYYGWRAVSRDRESFLRYRLAPLTGRGRPALAVSIGGDYCYPSMVKDLELANSMLNRQGTATLLLGCSIEPPLLTGDGAEAAALREDMRRYALIIAREGRTFRALREAGIPEAKLRQIPDPAFALPMNARVTLPDGFELALPVFEDGAETPVMKGGTVGINLSPMTGEYAGDPALLLRSVEGLIGHILAETDMKVALIPHVVWGRSDDRAPLSALQACFQGSGRVFTVEDQPAEDLKGIIGRCRFFIGARTHASIAAYSTEVPALVLGYSVKALGIAEEIFGTAENYVLPVQELREEQQLIRAWEWLLAHEQEIRRRLRETMPGYCEAALENGRAVQEVYRGLAE